MAFGNDSLTKAVNEAFQVTSGIPSGHKGAFLTVVGKDGVTAVVAHKINDHWVITAQAEHPWSGKLDGGVTVQATW